MSLDPNIFAYSDYRAFIRAWLVVPPRSFKFLAQRANCSKTLVSGILSGSHKLHRQRAEVFAGALRLDDEESRYFLLLVAYCDAETETAREEAWRQVAGIKRYRTSGDAERDLIAAFSKWWVPAILELARTSDFQSDPQWIADRMFPKITVEAAQEALTVLLQLGALQVSREGRIEAGDEAFVTRHEVRGEAVNAALCEMHREMMQRAGGALTEVPPEARQYGAVTLAVPSDSVADLKREIAQFQERIVGMCHPDHAPPDCVYQLSVQFFPLTTPPTFDS